MSVLVRERVLYEPGLRCRNGRRGELSNLSVQHTYHEAETSSLASHISQRNGGRLPSHPSPSPTRSQHPTATSTLNHFVTSIQNPPIPKDSTLTSCSIPNDSLDTPDQVRIKCGQPSMRRIVSGSMKAFRWDSQTQSQAEVTLPAWV